MRFRSSNPLGTGRREPSLSFLKVLGLQQPFTEAEAEHAFLEAAKAAHPDHGGDPKKFIELKQAYDQAVAFLQSPQARRPAPAPPSEQGVQIPLPRARSRRTSLTSWLVVGGRALVTLVALAIAIGGALTFLHRRNNTATQVDVRAAAVIERLGGSVTWQDGGVIAASLHGVPIDDRRLRALQGFSMLERVDLSRTTLDDRHLIRLLTIASLRELDLSYTRITDKGLTTLLGMPGLEVLVLDGTRVTPAALPLLDRMHRLRQASVQDTAITLADIASASYPERYVAGSSEATGQDQPLGAMPSSLASFLPERQWWVDAVRRDQAAHGLLTSDVLRSARVPGQPETDPLQGESAFAFDLQELEAVMAASSSGSGSRLSSAGGSTPGAGIREPAVPAGRLLHQFGSVPASTSSPEADSEEEDANRLQPLIFGLQELAEGSELPAWLSSSSGRPGPSVFDPGLLPGSASTTRPKELNFPAVFPSDRALWSDRGSPRPGLPRRPTTGRGFGLPTPYSQRSGPASSSRSSAFGSPASAEQPGPWSSGSFSDYSSPTGHLDALRGGTGP